GCVVATLRACVCVCVCVFALSVFSRRPLTHILSQPLTHIFPAFPFEQASNFITLSRTVKFGHRGHCFDTPQLVSMETASAYTHTHTPSPLVQMTHGSYFIFQKY